MVGAGPARLPPALTAATRSTSARKSSRDRVATVDLGATLDVWAYLARGLMLARLRSHSVRAYLARRFDARSLAPALGARLPRSAGQPFGVRDQHALALQADPPAM